MYILAYPTISFYVIFIILAVPIYFILKWNIKKYYKVSDLDTSDNKEVSSTVKSLSISLLTYYIGLVIGLLSSATIGFFIASIGVGLAIFNTQKLESFRTISLIEKKLGNKLNKVNVTKLENLIAGNVSKEISSKINYEELHNSIKKEIIEELKEELKTKK